ncbi:MAG: uracil-DNA glycosylase [Proteobacteria bacterium]|nr:uracil-DNA glycosylase [Pseudomonadota bacterium]
MEKPDSSACLAGDLAMRIGWEEENGCQGYGRVVQGGNDRVAQSSRDRVAQSSRDVLYRAAGAPSNKDLPELDNAQNALLALREEISNCTRCTLHTNRHNIVFGEGSPKARLIFVGEGPGRDEDLTGRPFVGAAGKLLDRIIAAMGLARADVYICNIVKCRPPGNRVPSEEEQKICGPFVERQLNIMQPDVVVGLGSTATQYLLDSNELLGRLKGRFHEALGLKIMPTYHPAYLLRNPSGKRQVWEHMQMVMATLGLPPAQTDGKQR